MLEALWDLVWAGEVTNDTLQPLRARVRPPDPARERRIAAARGSYGRSSLSGRRSTPPEAAGRWSLVRDLLEDTPTPTERITARVRQLLARFGLVTREIVQGESLPGGYSAAYPVLRAMEEAGSIRRGFFVEGLGALQFALPGALDRLRALRDPLTLHTRRRVPALPGFHRCARRERGGTQFVSRSPSHGLALSPSHGDTRRLRSRQPVWRRAALAVAIRRQAAHSHGRRARGAGGGRPVGWLSPDEKQLVTFLDALDPASREPATKSLAAALAAEVESIKRRAFLLDTIDDARKAGEPLHSALLAAGFVHREDGYQKRLG